MEREDSKYLPRGVYHGMMMMIQFDPTHFGIEYDTYAKTSFGANATIDYEKVVNAAIKYGFRQPSLIDALYFRNNFWDAHQYTEGTRYYIGCRPIAYITTGEPVKIIPVLEYDRYSGWSLKAKEVCPDSKLDVSFGHGQGEHYGSTFVFSLPQR